MINKIKQFFVNARNWIRRQIKKILITLGIIGVATAAALLPEPIPEDLLLKAPIDKIVQEEIKDEVVHYKYISDEKIEGVEFLFSGNNPFTSGRVIERSDKIVIAYDGVKVYKDESGLIYKIKEATTTPDAWERQGGKSLVEKIILFFRSIALADSQEYTSTDTWTAPAGVTSVDVECWAGGGGGGGSERSSSGGAGGGGGGAYSKTTGISVTPSAEYDVVVGTGGSGGDGEQDGSVGGDSYFDDGSEVKAKGGAGGKDGNNGDGGSGGATVSGIGDTKYSGGNGGDEFADEGGGGGGGAGDSENGGDDGHGSGSGGSGGDVGGGDGGAGGEDEGDEGDNGNILGGGGGGGAHGRIGNDGDGGDGARGKCVLAWKVTGFIVTSQAVTDIATTTATGNGTIVALGDEGSADKRGFVYSTSTQSEPASTTAPADSDYELYVEDTGEYATGTFTKTLTGLTESTDYYVRAYAHGSTTESYAYGNEVDFTSATEGVTIYNFVGIDSPSATHLAWDFEVDVLDPTDPPTATNTIDTLTDDGTTGGTPEIKTGIYLYSDHSEADDTEYDAIDASDDTYMTITDPGYGDNPIFWAQFIISEAEGDVTQIDVLIEGRQSVATDKLWLGIWDDTNSFWHYLEAYGTTTDYEYTGSVTSTATNFINASSTITILLFNEDDNDPFYIDYAEIGITSEEEEEEEEAPADIIFDTDAQFKTDAELN